MRSRLLQHAIQTLHLRPDAPWPGHCEDTRAMVQQWRRLQRARLLESPHDRARSGNPKVETGRDPHKT